MSRHSTLPGVHPQVLLPPTGPGARATQAGPPTARGQSRRRAVAATLILLALLLSGPLEARKIEGEVVRETVILPDGEFTELILHGAGMREKGVFNVYVAGLYLQGLHRGVDSPEAIHALPGARRMALRILTDEISALRMVRSWHEALADNLDPTTRERLRQPLNDFVALFPDLRAGDRVDIDIYPDDRVTLAVNSEPLGEQRAPGLGRAVLSVWLGPAPPDPGLKDALLGRQRGWWPFQGTTE